MSDTEPTRPNLMSALTQIVSAHLANANTALATAEVSPFIREVHETLAVLDGTGAPIASASGNVSAPVPAVPIDQSVFPEYLICLEDGRKLKMLKRHLQVAYGMTPEQYRQKWRLPATYPIVAPEYAAHRKMIAEKIGLGQKKVNRAAAPSAEPVAPLSEPEKPKTSGKRTPIRRAKSGPKGRSRKGAAV